MFFPADENHFNAQLIMGTIVQVLKNINEKHYAKIKELLNDQLENTNVDIGNKNRYTIRCDKLLSKNFRASWGGSGALYLQSAIVGVMLCLRLKSVQSSLSKWR